MRSKQANPIRIGKRKNRSYDPQALINAYKSVKEDGVSVNRASIQFNVPSQTLRDRILGKTDPECTTTGRSPFFSLEEEANIVNHLKKMALLGYGYTRQELVDVANDFAGMLGKDRQNKKNLTIKWFRGFKRRWPELRVLKPRSLEHSRAKASSKENVQNFFSELKTILDKYNLHNSPHLIFNIDEKGVTQNHVPPHIVTAGNFHPLAVTSGKSNTTTIIGCGSAAGVAIPPYFVFSGARMRDDLLAGSTPGASGTVSENGWSNGTIFDAYLKHHFTKYVPGGGKEHILILLDGHKTHITPPLIDWAKDHNISIMVLPAHTSHILQPLDVGCYGPLQRMYNDECHKTMRSNSSVITKYDVCRIACKAYTKALSPENLQGAFKRTGICPFNEDAVDEHALIPATVFQQKDMEVDDDENKENTRETDTSDHEDTHNEPENNDETDLFTRRENKLIEIKSNHHAKERNTLGKIVSGKIITEGETETKIRQHMTKNTKGKSPCTKQQKKAKKAKSPLPEDSQQPGPSRINLNAMTYNSETDDDEVDDNEKCCVCNKFTPEDIRKSSVIEFTNWGQCDQCNHWVHLKYCTPIRAIRKGMQFLCIHCYTN